ncbi:MAG: hypothetical protein SX243_13430 [Acidobacteriota bacterium]|nr:hypothetical protein [Acidobacteriota bacterium]
MSMFRWTLLSTLAVGCFLLLPITAEACTDYECQNVPQAGNPFCMRCVDTGQPTNANCQNMGSCGCLDVQCAASDQEASATSDYWLNEAPNGLLEACPVPVEVVPEASNEGSPAAA